MTGFPRCLVLPLIAAAIALAPAPARAQDSDDLFKRGIDARNDRRWPDVVSYMRGAIKAQPKESTRKIGSTLGLGGTEYMPHYLLGDALFQQGDCAGAVEAWAVSEQQGTVKQKAEFFSSLQRGYQQCAMKGILLPPQFDKLNRTTVQAYTTARALAEGLYKIGMANRDVWQGDFEATYGRGQREIETAFKSLDTAGRTRLATDFEAALGAVSRATEILQPLEARFKATLTNIAAVRDQARSVEQAIAQAQAIDQSIEPLKGALTAQLAGSRRDAQAQITDATNRLSAGLRSQSQSAVAEAGRSANAAAATLTTVLDGAKKLGREVFVQRLDEAAASATQAFAVVDASLATLDRLSAEKAPVPEVVSEREAIQKDAEALRRRLDRSRRAEDLASVQATARLTTDLHAKLDALIKSFGPVTLRDRGVHEALEEGARLFFGGEYRKARAVLSPVAAVENVRLPLHVHLFRAAAAYALYVQSGEADRTLLDQAVSEAATCKQIDPAFAPDPRAFSPRFISFYQAGSAGATQASAPGPAR